MANRGVYGTIRPAVIDINNDIEVYYNYRPSRAYDSVTTSNFKVGETSWLTYASGDTIGTLYGMFNLKLPLNVFGSKGIYTIYIKPREITATIYDVGVLAAFPDVKGIVLDGNTFPEQQPDLEGYRVEFIDDGGRGDEFRIITSNGSAEPVIQNLTNSNQKSVRYRYTDAGNLQFCTVSPSSAQSFKPNAIPFVGRAGQTIRLINTKFNPTCVEIEMVDRDIETVSNMLEGSQIRNLDNGLITTFNRDREIFSQSEFSTLKDQYTGKPLYDIKMNKEDDIAFTESWNNVVTDL